MLRLNEEIRCVAFLDVLGFKEVLNKGATQVNYYYEEIESARTKVADVDSYLLGDAIVLSKPIAFSNDGSHVAKNTKSLLDLLIAIGNIQWNLALMDIWTRGAVCVGTAYCDANFITGDALARAASLEQNVARFPRTIVDPQILTSRYFSSSAGHLSYKNPGQLIDELNTLSKETEWKAHIVYDWMDHDLANLRPPIQTTHLHKDVPMFVDYLAHVNKLHCNEQLSYIIELLEIRSRSDISHFPKYRWVCDYLRARLAPDKHIFQDALSALIGF